MTTGDRIRQLRTQLGMSQEELGEKIGVKKAAIHKYENGLVVNLKRSTIRKLAVALNTTPSDLLGFYDLEKNQPDEKEKDLLQNYRKLNNLGQHEVRKRAAELVEMPRYLKSEESAPSFYEIDCYDMPASAGSGMYLSDADKEVIRVQDSYEARRADFVVPVSGDSMEPEFSDGDLAFIKSMPTVEVGEIGIFVVNGNAYIKKRGRCRLVSLNPAYKDIVFHDGDTIVCLGKVIGKAEQM